MPRAWYSTEKTQSVAKRVAVFFVTIGICWGLSSITFFAPVVHKVQSTAYAVSTWMSGVLTRVFANDVTVSGQLALCATERDAQAERAANAQAMADEVQEWRALVGYKERVGTSGIAARIIARSDAASGSVVIDRGANDGIVQGTAVIVGDGLLLGTIRDVHDTESTVRLIEHRDSAIAAKVYGASKTLGLVHGNEGALLTMEYISQDAAIAPGQTVVTSGLGGMLPEGLVLGVVQEVFAQESAPFIQATITPLHDARAYTAVIVLPKPSLAL